MRSARQVRSSGSKRATLERMWAEGAPTSEIAEAMGWKRNSPPANYISVYRQRGYNLPPREDEALVRAKAEARWGPRK